MWTGGVTKQRGQIFGTGNCTSLFILFITSSMALPNWARCRFGRIQSRTKRVRWNRIKARWRWGVRGRCRSCFRPRVASLISAGRRWRRWCRCCEVSWRSWTGRATRKAGKWSRRRCDGWGRDHEGASRCDGKGLLSTNPKSGGGEGEEWYSDVSTIYPGGTRENSPTFQRWDFSSECTSPEGTTENSEHVGRPFGTQSSWDLDPKVETLGYFRLSLRDQEIHPDRGSFFAFKS